jgi:hypothetical protein
MLVPHVSPKNNQISAFFRPQIFMDSGTGHVSEAKNRPDISGYDLDILARGQGSVIASMLTTLSLLFTL